MIVSPGRRYIFVHIPKTGGTSMTLALEARAKADDLIIADTPKGHARRNRLNDLPARGRIWKHSRLSDLDGWIGADELDRFFVFTLVRNPWDRMVSYYHWLKAQDFDHPAVALAHRAGFAAFLADPITAATALHDQSSDYLRDASGRDRASACIRLEHLEEDIVPLTDHLGFRPDLLQSNASNRPGDYRTCYDHETRAIVLRLYAADIARFGYRF